MGDLDAYGEVWIPGHTMIQKLIHKKKHKKNQDPFELWAPGEFEEYRTHGRPSPYDGDPDLFFDVDSFSGFDWTFGLGSKAKKDKAKAKAEKKETLLQQREENLAEKRLSDQRQLQTQVQRQKAGKAMMVGGVVLGVVVVGTIAYFALRKKKGKKR